MATRNDTEVRFTREHIPALDALRAVSAIFVLWSHLYVLHGPSWIGIQGVYIFFVLSGFLITRVLMCDIQGGQTLGSFYRRRAARIFPPYYLMLGAVVLAWGRPWEVFLAATYTMEFFGGPDELYSYIAHAWSLCVEEAFYLIWPAVLLTVGTKWARVGCVALIVACPFMWELHTTYFKTINSPISGTMFLHFPALAFGCLFAFIEPWCRKHGWWVGIILLVISTPLFVGHVLLFQGIGLTHGDGAIISNRLAIAVGCFLLFISAGRWMLIAERGPLPAFGRISYGVYVYHMPVLMAVGMIEYESAYVEIAGLVLIVVVSVISYRFIEQPIVRWARKSRTETESPAADLQVVPAAAD